MATILLNGVATDASSITGSDLADKLTVSGGVDGLSVDLDAGDDLVEIYAGSEDVTDTEIRVSVGDDTIFVVAEDGTNNNNINDADDFAGLPVSLGDSLLGGPGDDTITVADGLVQLTGAVKGNEGDDDITVGYIDGGTVNGNAGDDTISIGDVAETAGSQAGAHLHSGSVMGGKGDDTITVDVMAMDSAIRGNEGDDTLTIAGDFSGAITLNGNAGDDTIDASGVEGAITVIGGKGDDTLIVGNGQTVKGGLGADLFSVEASGGVTIEDYDELVDEECFCDDAIQIDGNKVELESYSYNINRVDFTSASSWVGNLKVKAVIDADNCPTTAKVTYTATKTETLTAKAVAYLKVTETKNTNTYSASLANPAPAYPAKGFTQNEATFVNGLAGYEYGDARGGIGQGFASGTAFWLTDGGGLPAGNVTASSVKLPYASTSAAFAKGDFSFLQLTKTAKAGCTTTQKLVYDDVTRGTVTNHHVSYLKEKITSDAELYSMSFGTANFATAYTGKGYMIVTDGLEDKAYKTTTLEAVTVGATAKVTLTLNNFFSAWLPNNAGTGTASAAGNWDFIKTTGFAGAPAGLPNAASGRYETAGGGIAFNLASAAVDADGVATFTAADAVTSKQAFWSTLQNRGLLTLTVKAVAPQAALPATALTALAGPATGSATASYTANITEVDRDIFVTNIGKHVVKIRVSDTDTAKATKALATIVERTTFTNTILPVTTCPSFPATPYGNGKFAVTANRTGKHGDLVTADGGTAFGAHLLWQNTGLRMDDYFIVDDLAASNDGVGVTGDQAVLGLISGAVKAVTVSTTQSYTTNTVFGAATNTITKKVAGTALTTTTFQSSNQGFFSGSDWKVSVLAAAGMGNNVATDVDGAPFRVLFFDNEGTDNGLYVYSGTANYEGGNVTAINTNPTGSSAMGGKHTIVKVTAGKGHEIALSDINFV